MNKLISNGHGKKLSKVLSESLEALEAEKHDEAEDEADGGNDAAEHEADGGKTDQQANDSKKGQDKKT